MISFAGLQDLKSSIRSLARPMVMNCRGFVGSTGKTKWLQRHLMLRLNALQLWPNGRFETQTKICLSISNYHPHFIWQPSWSVRTAFVALIAFMPTNPNGALGSLDYKKEERRCLVIKSRGAAPKFGTSERQRLIDETACRFTKICRKAVPPNSSTCRTRVIDEHPTNAKVKHLLLLLDGDNIATPDESSQTPAKTGLTLERSMPMQSFECRFRR
ncbi:hypothetical protein IFM89_039295 [Coptis chinensis]|uniref:Uncharacterized protein n=1 Tax=Coptis chinensis TaxID=261450 RepID=A0A835LYB7_9MAGN|nr:hypothetical protein IFM89_039295 [Coptis chinensis]